MNFLHFIFSALITQVISFYTLSISDADGNSVPFSSFAGKKVLIVNTSMNTSDTVQYRKLEQLWQRDHDSLEIIAIPSNDFGHAPDSISNIKSFLQATYNIHYILAQKQSVKGPAISALYQWLGNISQNGMINSAVEGDYYKYLIDKDGKLIGVFGTKTDPMGRIKWAVEQ